MKFSLWRIVSVIVVSAVSSGVYGQDTHWRIREMERARFLRMTDTFRERIHASRDTTFDVTYYRISLWIQPSSEEIGGEVTTRGISSVSGLDQIILDLFDNMEVDSVMSEGRHLTHAHSDNRLTIDLVRSYGKGDRFDVTVYYHGHPVEAGGFHSFNFNHHNGTPVVSTLSEPFGSPAWWPCKDDPADKADSVDIVIRVPDSLVVASNGVLKRVTDHGDGTRTYVWSERYPIATYLVSLAISNYDRFSHVYVAPSGDSMEVLYFVYPEHLSNAKEDFSVTVPMIEFYASVFGEYPFVGEKYGMAEFPWWGGMEHQTCTSYGAPLIQGDHSFDWIIAHELAHQWFGDFITMRWWSHIWLNEGFATYSEALWQEYQKGQPGYLEYMDGLDPGLFPGSVFVRDSTEIHSLFSQTVYNKGAWILHMLRHVLGDTVFFGALKTYVASHGFGNTTTGDFRRTCELAYGEPLGWFFDQWVYGESRPSYQVGWSSSPEGDHHLTSVLIRQAQASLFKMPLDVVLTTASRETTVVVWDSLKKQIFEFVTEEEPTAVMIDPDGWVLKEIASSVDVAGAGEVPRSFALLPNYPNPFNTGTRIPYRLGSTANVSATIFNLEGQRIRRLEGGIRPPGDHDVMWDGLDDRGVSVSSGIYFLRLHARTEGDLVFNKTGKMILMR